MSPVEQIEAAANGAADPDAPRPIEVIDAPEKKKSSWLSGPGDLIEFDLPVDAVGDVVTVRALSAGQRHLITTETMHMAGDKMTFDATRRAVMTFAEGVVSPSFTEAEANVIAHKWGPAFDLVVDVINEISKTQDDALEKARRKFRHLLYVR